MIRDSEARVLKRLLEDEARDPVYAATAWPRGCGRLLGLMWRKGLILREGYGAALTELGRLKLSEWRPKPRPEP